MFPDIWKNPTHKKGDKLSIITDQCHYYQFKERYLKKLIFNSIYEYDEEKQLL